MSSNTTTVGVDSTGTARAKEAAQQLRHDVIMSAVLIMVTVVYAIEIARLPVSSPNQADVGPRAYPILILVLLGACTLALVGITIVRWVKRDRRKPARDGEETRALIRVGLILGISAIYVVLMNPLGFAISTALYLAALYVVIGGTRTIRGVLIALAFGCIGGLSIYLLFGTALGLLLPAGPLPF